MHQIFLVPQLQILRDLPSDEISSGDNNVLQKKNSKHVLHLPTPLQDIVVTFLSGSTTCFFLQQS